jgi:putative oligomerization/nucleic acid binding protein
MPLVRRPLLRAAMVGGAGYMAGKNAQAAQVRESDEQQRLAALEQQQVAGAQPAPAAAAPQQDLVSKLKELKELQDSGALSAEEFEVAKQKLLQG